MKISDTISMARELLEIKNCLTSWEIDFMEGTSVLVDEYDDQGYAMFTERQVEVLESIWQKVCGR